MSSVPYQIVPDGGVCSPRGFQAGSARAGIKRSGNPDVSIIRCDVPAQFAAAFTQNSFAAAPVQYCRQLCKTAKHIRALVSNSGNANACTGRQGMQDARAMASAAAEAMNLSSDEIFVFSTGRIGVPMPMDKVRNGIRMAAEALKPNANRELAEAIMTTDTVPKHMAVEVVIDGCRIRIGGSSKGAGMIAPQMAMATEKHATMFCFMTTDARLEPGFLSEVMERSLKQSFNRVTVDGDTSTNDSFIALSSGLAENPAIRSGTIEAEQFQKAFDYVARELAKWLVRDGEGVTKVVELHVGGAKSDADAEVCARAIANSLLCKTAWFGADPNWGRILDAAGYSGIYIEPDRVSLYYDKVPVVKHGADAGEPESRLAEVLKQKEFRIDLDLGLANGECTLWTCDLSYEYVKINADYHT